MRTENRQVTTLYADEGKVLVNKRTGAVVADSKVGINLGYDYYELGIGLKEPHWLTPDDLDEVEGSMEHPPVIDQAWRLEQITRKLEREKKDFNTLGLTAEQMLTHKAFAPKWGEDEGFREGDNVVKGNKFTYGGKLYAVLQNHTILPHYYPSENTASLYVEVTPDYTEEGEEYGTLENPIPYEGNMVLEEGRYYTQNGVAYLCTRDSGNAVYHALAELVGLYVEEVA